MTSPLEHVHEGDIITSQFLNGVLEKLASLKSRVTVLEKALQDNQPGTESGTISGQVISQTGAPLPGVNVVVEGTQYGGLTNANGNYSIQNVPPGIYTVKASFIGAQTVTKSGEVVSGKTLTLNFQL